MGVDAVIVRKCQPEEVAGVLELWRAAGAPEGATDDLAALRTLMSRDEDALLVAEVSGELVGSLIVGWDGWRGNLYRLAVAPDHRGAGVAAELVRAAERSLRARGARRITALVLAEEEGAIGFWRAAGYRRDERIARFVKDLGAGRSGS